MSGPSGKSRLGIATQDLESAVYGAEELEETAKPLQKAARRGFARQVNELVQTSSSANSAPGN
jgi:hypothetical protein